MDSEKKIAAMLQVGRKLAVLPALLALMFASSAACDVTSLTDVLPRAANGVPLQHPDAAQFADAARLVVMIEANLDGTPSQGAGVVFAVRDNTAYILTANHVVRSSGVATSIRVFFSVSPDLPVAANVLPQHSTDLDLAVLQVEVSTVDLQPEKVLPFDLLLGDSAQMKRTDPVFPIGYPEGLKWDSPILVPDRFDHADGQHLYFQTHNVKVGYSGGPVCSANWHVVGIVLAVAQAPVVRALPIEIARQQLKQWGFVIGTATTGSPVTSATVLPPATEDAPKKTEGGLKEGQTSNGAVFRTFSPWGGFSQADQTWTQLVAQRIQGLPPVKTGFGNIPDFILALSRSSGEPTYVSLGRSNRCTFPPSREQDLDGALIRLTWQGLFSTNEVTYPAAITFPKVEQGQLLKLRYVDKVMQEVRDLTDSTEVTMFMQARSFFPDSQSGADKDPETAEVLRAGTVKEDSVSFDDGDATDHVVLNPDGVNCKGFLWIESTGNIGLTSTARRVNESSVFLALEGASEPKVKLYEIRCDGKRTIIRIQAETPGSRANYDLFVNSGSEASAPQLQSPLVQSWIGGWVRSQEEAFEFRKVTESEWSTIDRGLGIIRQYTGGTTEDFIAALNAAIDEGTEKMFEGIKEGYWRFLESIVSRHLDEVSKAIAQCCKESAKVRFMASLLRAEAKLPYDRAALDWAKTQPRLPEPLRARVTLVTSQKPAN